MMQASQRGRGRGRRAAATLLALASLLVAAGAHEDGLRDEYEQTQQQLESAKQQLGQLEAQVGVVEDDLRAADERVVGALSELHRVEHELAAAQAAYAEAKAATDQATQQLLTVTDRLDRAQRELGEAQRVRDARVTAVYKYGRVAYLDAFLGARDFSELVTTGKYVSNVLDQDRRVVHQVTDLVADVAEARAEADRLREVAVSEEQTALAAQQRVQQLTDQQRAAARLARAEQEERARIMERLQSDVARTESLVEELEEESKALAAELARSRWRAGAPGAGELIWPTDGRAGSGYGWRTHPISGTRRFHAGVDISGPVGQPIHAAAEGLVVHAGWRGGYGLAVVIDHGGGLATLYAHQSNILVREGQVVSKGQQIGMIGSTGYSTGPHLHYEVRVNGEPKNPMDWY